jgi:preprotein translocase subunit SecF
MELFKNTNIDFLGKKWIFIGASLVLTAIGLASWIAKGSLRYGIDFTGGVNVSVRFAGQPPVEKIRSAVSAKIPGEISVQEVSGENTVIIGTALKTDKEQEHDRRLIGEALNTAFGEPSGKLDFNNTSEQALADRLRDPLIQANAGLNEDQLRALAAAMLKFKNTPPRSGLIKSFDELAAVPGVTPAVIKVLKDQGYTGPFAVVSAEVVGPKIGAELRTKAVYATLYALGGMLVYLWFRFELIYGAAAVIAVFHDVIITLGLFSLFNKVIDLNVVAALLTLVGYSMNDTIVVFDRIREKLKLSRKDPLEVTVNKSINETLSRTVLTSGLTFIAAISLFLFGGSVLHAFSFALVVGIIVGTYSSIFVASPILVFWHNLVEERKKGTGSSGSAVAPARETVRKK